MVIWRLHGNGKTVGVGEILLPDERLTWPRTISMGLQHIVAMFGSTFLVPLLTGFPPATTLFFSAIATILFLLITGNKLPSYLGSSFAFIAPITAAKANSIGSALFGIMLAGATLAIVGIVVQFAGAVWIDRIMPPVVTGTIVMLIGFNLAPAAWGSCNSVISGGEIVQECTSGVRAAPITAGVTIGAILLITVLFKGLIGRLSVLLGVLVGYGVAVLRGEVDFRAVENAPLIGFPHFQHPTVDWSVIGLFLPVVLVLIAENIGHVKSVSSMTGRDLGPLTGRALMADGVSTILAGLGGGSGTTTYAENIGVMAATRIYSTAVYWVAGIGALLLAMFPKFGAIIATIPVGVLGGAGTVLYGMIGLLGARIWVQNKVDFSSPISLMTAAVALIAGIANFTFTLGSITLEGIAVGSAAAIICYHLMNVIARLRGTSEEPATPASVPGGDERELGA